MDHRWQIILQLHYFHYCICEYIFKLLDRFSKVVLSLICCFDSTGEPTPEMSWYKGKKHIKSSKKDKRIKISFDEANKLSKLQISEAVIEDSGEYTIKIGNEVSS